MKCLISLVLAFAMTTSSCKREIEEPQILSDFTLCDTVVFAGDSQFAENWLTSIPTRFHLATGLPVINASQGGWTSYQIADNYCSHPEYQGKPVIIWLGRNNNWESERIKYDLQRIIGNNRQYLILQILPGDLESEWKGTPYYEHDQQLNQEIADEFGHEHFLWLIEPLQSLADGSFADSMSVVHGIVPASFRRDFLHNNDLGNYAENELLLSRFLFCKSLWLNQKSNSL